MKLTIEGTPEEIKNVFQTDYGGKKHIEIDGQKVAIALSGDPRPTMYFGDTEPKNPRKGDIWDSRHGIKHY